MAKWTASWALAGEPRSRRGDPPAAAVRAAPNTLLQLAHTACACLPGCRSPPSPVAAQVAGPRTAATTKRSASGREARQSFAIRDYPLRVLG